MAVANTRKRMFLMMKFLYEKSDEDHPLTRNEIMEYLFQNGVTADRKTFREDMEFLIDEMDCDIVVIKSSPNKYFWGERFFEMPEFKMLIDAVSSSRFINQTKSTTIINKLMILAGERQREKLIRNVFSTGKTKSDNNKIYYIVDVINNAINQKKKVCFKYYEYNGNKEKVLRHDGEEYKVSPYALYWNEDNYYMVGYLDKRGDIAVFRVDRLCNPQITEERAVRKPKNFNIADYGNKIFHMFGGEEIMVELECHDELMKYIVDLFGTNANTVKTGDDTFTAKVPVALSPTFFGWVFQFGEKMRIIGPEEAVMEFERMKKI